jgi:hypothetical protein
LDEKPWRAWRLGVKNSNSTCFKRYKAVPRKGADAKNLFARQEKYFVIGRLASHINQFEKSRRGYQFNSATEIFSSCHFLKSEIF